MGSIFDYLKPESQVATDLDIGFKCPVAFAPAVIERLRQEGVSNAISVITQEAAEAVELVSHFEQTDVSYVDFLTSKDLALGTRINALCVSLKRNGREPVAVISLPDTVKMVSAHG